MVSTGCDNDMQFFTILLIVVALVYAISPYDIIPDIFPITGWLDDTFLIGILIYYLKFRRLPAFLVWLLRASGSARPQDQQAGTAQPHAEHRENGFRSFDPYQILGVQPDAQADEIRAAYRRAAQRYHPDKVANLGPEFQELAQKRFLEIQNVYRVLLNKQK